METRTKKNTLSIRKIALLLLTSLNICYFTNNITAKTIVHSNQANAIEFVKSSSIKTVKISQKGWELSDPIIELNNSDKILLTFDDLSDNSGTYSYTITHCNSNWELSGLFINDYMDGFEVNEIRNYSFSSGTTTSYIHYQLEIPNNDVRLKISGNYILRVFDTYNPEEIVLQRRFMVYEPLANISASIRQPLVGESRLTGQQMELKVNTSSIRITDPYAEIKTQVCQNHIAQGCKENLKPTYINGNELDYTAPDALIFDGVNEFRLFDSKSIRYNGQGIKSVNNHGGEFHIELNEDMNRWQNRYTYYPDINGRFVVNMENSEQSHIEADYAWVYFTLKSPLEVDMGKSVYLFGELTGWELSPKYSLNYNFERKAYEVRLYLKQGAYNYRYLVVDNNTLQVDATHFEGSYYDTENTYTVLVYYTPIGSRYDRLIGYKKVSTNK